jgi:hypothetical protein
MLSALCFLLPKNVLTFIEDNISLCYTYHRDDRDEKDTNFIYIMFLFFN